MNAFQIAWFADEVKLQCDAALTNYERIVQLIGNEHDRQLRAVWIALTAFLSHVGIVAQFVAGNTKAAAATVERRNELRAILEISEDSPILSRAARNSLQHFDERMDNWVAKDRNSIIEMVTPNRAGCEHFADESRHAIRRLLIADELVFVTEDAAGKRLELKLQPVQEEIDYLSKRCEDQLARSPYNFIGRSSPLLPRRSRR